MPRYPKDKSKENLPGSELPVLTAEEHDFFNLYAFDPKINCNATACYKRIKDTSHLTEGSISVLAFRMKEKVKPYLDLHTQSKVEQSARTKDYRIAEMEAFADRCEAAGQYGAAFQARQAVGKLEGQYIEMREDVNKTRDQVSSLKALAQSMGTEKAMDLARMCGMDELLLKELAAGNA